MDLRFTKMHGAGNDFMVVDAINQQVELTAGQIRQLANRHFGVGFDQLLLVESPRDEDTDFYYRIFNADGSEVEQCGNGARCFARFVHDKGLSKNHMLRVGTAKGTILLYLEEDNLVRVNMGAPDFVPENIPFIAEQRADQYELDVDGKRVQIGALSLGNPHAVLLVDDLDKAPVSRLGQRIEKHQRFPKRTNVGFMQVLSPDSIRLRVYERGTGETLACGSGACAAVVYGIHLGLLHGQVEVEVKGGQLIVSWDQKDQEVWLKGPSQKVYEGELKI